jgi:hypothetical protein
MNTHLDGSMRYKELVTEMLLVMTSLAINYEHMVITILLFDIDFLLSEYYCYLLTGALVLKYAINAR